ncbi:MAG: flavodoxin domain-containing protein [Erysipelotrichales bacterium]|nr:flavodoxin domain-containing protein [Erysipelotrichales bacterium]
MKVILYKTRHGSTKKIGKVINQYIGDCFLMSIDEIDNDLLQRAEMIIIGTPVYYGRIDQDIVRFIKDNQDLLIPRHYCLYVVGVLQNEFMNYVTHAFDYSILKHISIIVGVGGALYYPELSISEKMILQVMNKRSFMISKQKDKDMFENFNNEEIELFANKIKKIKK